jgi:excisionase family DNA binding protein
MNLNNWPTEAEAAAQLSMSLRTLQRYAKAGEIEIRQRPVPGRKPEAVVNPRDVERLKPGAFVMAPEQDDKVTPRQRQQPADVLGALFAYLQQQQRLLAAPPAPWLTLDEAAEQSRLSRRFLRKQIRSKKIRAVRGGPHGALRIHRASLEGFKG